MNFIKNKSIAITIFVSLLFFVSPGDMFASDSNNLPFDVSIDIPDNQDPSIRSYFSLDVKPEQKQTVYVHIKNNKANQITVNVTSANALNSPSGGIIYTEAESEKYSSLIDPNFYMAKNITVQNKIILQPYEEKMIPIEISLPSINEGKLLGGLIFKLENAAARKINEEDTSVSLVGKINVAQAIAIQLNLPKDVAKKSLKLTEATTESLANGINIAFNLENINGTILMSERMKYKVLKNDQVIFEGTIPNFNVAPKSKVEMLIPWDAGKIKEGNYNFIVESASNKALYTGGIKVTKTNLLDYSKRSGQKIIIPYLKIPIYYYIIAGLLIVIMLYAAYRFGTKKRNNEEDKHTSKVA
jgi:F0F1-type ATP synthase delta subunit